MKIEQIRSTSVRESIVFATDVINIFTMSVLDAIASAVGKSIEEIGDMTYGEICDNVLLFADKTAKTVRDSAIALWELLCAILLVFEWAFQDCSLEPGEEKLVDRLKGTMNFYLVSYRDRVFDWKVSASKRLTRIYAGAMKH